MVVLRFLGTGNAFGHSGRRRSHYLLEGSRTWLIDASYDALPGLRSIGMSHKDLHAIFISHLHPDHYMALPQMALEDYYVIKKSEPIPVYGPIGISDKISKATKLLFNEEVYEHVNRLFQFIEVGIDEFVELQGGSLRTLEAKHSGNARMQIFTLDNKSIGYTGDSAFYWKSFEQLLSCDLIITEASSANHPIPDHTTLEELQNAKIPDQARIYLSHLGESVIQKETEINPPLYLAYDGLTINI